VTGSRDTLSDSVQDLIRRLKSLTTVPICVGFGISKPEHARAVADAGADGAIIGSRIVGMVEAHLDDPGQAIAEVSAFVRQVKAALSNSFGFGGTNATLIFTHPDTI
jgi:tryptophan synthase alpha chain